MALVVQKYGGTSVGTIDRIKHVAKHIIDTVQSGHQVVAVISAMGAQTDELLTLAHAISSNPPRRELDMLLTAGERIAMALVSIALSDKGTKAVSLTGSQSGIITDTTHGNARISKITGQRIQENLDLGAVVIVAGFQGVSQETREITTLGRGGTDLSAIALAGSLKADFCQLYKDIDGVYSADPNVVKDAKKRDHLTWDEMTLMAWNGAGVLHPRGAHLAANFQLKIEIRSSFALECSGTIISGKSEMEKYVVQAITHRDHMDLVSFEMLDSSAGGLHAVRQWLWEQGESPQVQLQWSEGDKTRCRWSVPEKYIHTVERLIRENCSPTGKVAVERCTIVAIIGSGFWQSPELMPVVQAKVSDAYFVDIKNNALTIAVPSVRAEAIIQDLHNVLM